ncbi:aminoglycoside phosphotransferase family protein [Nocardioides nanhaiensis]|uniref:Aminoglycoside phosphotransferase domain-containing protein n=1 Tax=Nocardioides nanhaiensis TaxID=1476871 RepID=A0ABP8X2S1_9ACTN
MEGLESLGLTALTPLEGGWSGRTFLAAGGGPDGDQVVRIYPPGDDAAGRGEAAAEVDAALLRLVRGLLPVPEVLEVRRPLPEHDQPGLLVTSVLPGVRGDLLLPTLDDDGQRRAGAAVGAVAAVLGAIPMLREGPLVDADLRIGSWEGPDCLADWVEQSLPALAHWSQVEQEALRGLAADVEELLADVDRVCLAHSDLNPKNLLLDPATLAVTGVLDWEFAHAGHPATDLGNLLRFESGPRWAAYGDAVLDAYRERHGGDRDELVLRARAADLLPLLLLATRRGENPVADRAHDLLLAMARDERLDVAFDG